jgi:hypothetical protein
LKTGLTPGKNVDHKGTRADALGHGVDRPLRECNQGVIRGLELLSVSNAQNDIGGSMSEMCLKFYGDTQQ